MTPKSLTVSDIFITSPLISMLYTWSSFSPKKISWNFPGLQPSHSVLNQFNAILMSFSIYVVTSSKVSPNAKIVLSSAKLCIF